MNPSPPTRIRKASSNEQTDLREGDQPQIHPVGQSLCHLVAQGYQLRHPGLGHIGQLRLIGGIARDLSFYQQGEISSRNGSKSPVETFFRGSSSEATSDPSSALARFRQSAVSGTRDSNRSSRRRRNSGFAEPRPTDCIRRLDFHHLLQFHELLADLPQQLQQVLGGAGILQGGDDPQRQPLDE